MLQKQLEEVIEYTDTDLYADAVDSFNEFGVVSGNALPFLEAVFNQAPEQLIKRLKEAGFRGEVTLTLGQSAENTSGHVLYDANRYSSGQAIERLAELS